MAKDQKLVSYIIDIVKHSALLNLWNHQIYRTAFFDILTQQRPPSSMFPVSRMKKQRVDSVIWDTRENDVKHVSSLVTNCTRFSGIFAMIIIASNKWNIWVIDQAWGQDGLSSFLACLWTETESRSINTQEKERGQYLTMLFEQAWSINYLLYGIKNTKKWSFLRDTARNPEWER